MKMVKKTGLVPVKDAGTGSVYGVKPAKAREMIAAKSATLVDIPEGIETVDLGDVSEPKSADKPAEVSGPEIPEDWESMHHLQRVKLALAIHGDFTVHDGEKKSDAADRIIREEVQRRAAAVAGS